MAKIRTIEVKDAKLKKVLAEKKKLVNKQREDVEKQKHIQGILQERGSRIDLVKEDIFKLSEKHIASIEVSEFEEVATVELEKGKIIFTVRDVVEDMKDQYLKQKEAQLKKEKAEKVNKAEIKKDEETK